MLKKMTKKMTLYFALSCVLSLGIGVVLGYGIQTQGLTGTSVLSSDTQVLTGTSVLSSDIQGLTGTLVPPSDIQNISDTQLPQSQDAHFLYAQKCLEQAEYYKELAMEEIQKIKELQELYTRLQVIMVDYRKAETKEVTVDRDFLEDCLVHIKDISYSETKEKTIIISGVALEEIQNTLNDNITTSMVSTQYYMNQYNSYLQSANYILTYSLNNQENQSER